MSQGLHERDRGVIIRVLERDLIRDQLIMETRLGQGFGSCHSLVNDVNDVLNSSSENAAPSCCSYYEVQLPIRTSDDGWGDG